MKEDLRVQKTKNIIKDTFVQMIGEIGYQNITVKTLCERALINRNTFYLHYSDKDDLVKGLMSDSIKKLQDNLKDFSFFDTILAFNYEVFQKEVNKIVSALSVDIELYRVLLVDNYLSGYFKIIEVSFENYLINNLHLTTKKQLITLKYIVSGIYGILIDWIVNDTTSIDETATVLAKLVYDNFIYLEKKD